ncbi:9050_t:CDS:2, partial [Gigaspora rosea]
SAGTRHVDKTDNCRPCRKSVEKDGTRKPNSGINISMKDNEAHKIDKKVTGIERVDEIIEPGLNNKIEIGKKDPKEYRDLANITIRPLGLYIEEIGACDTGYIKETSIRVDIYIKYYKSAKMWYRDRAYNLGYRHQMGINIEEEGYKVIGKSIYVRILISKAMSPGIGISFEFENVLVKVERS